MTRILHPVDYIKLKAPFRRLFLSPHKDPRCLVPVCQGIGGYPVPVIARYLVISRIACHFKRFVEIEPLVHQVGDHKGHIIIKCHCFSFAIRELDLEHPAKSGKQVNR